MKFRGIFRNNVPGILNIGTFTGCSMNILRMLHTFFSSGSRNTIVLFSLSWHCDIVTTFSQRCCWCCHNAVARSKIRVLPTSVFDVATTSLSDVIKTLPQHCYNVATILTTGFLDNFTTDYFGYSFPSPKRERITKVLSGIKPTSSLFKRTLYL